MSDKSLKIWSISGAGEKLLIWPLKNILERLFYSLSETDGIQGENVPELQFRRRPPDASVSASEVLWGCGHRDGSLETFGSASGASGLEVVGTALNKEISSNGEI